jgi:hypothetical protein
MEITSIQDVSKLLSTAEVSEQYEVATTNVFSACVKHRLTEDEAVETAVGWFITREGAERLWKPRQFIEDFLRDKFMGKTWPREDLLQLATKEVRAVLTAERKRKCRLELLDADRLQVEFKDKRVIFYNDSTDGHNFHISDVSPVQETFIYTSPRGRKDEVFRESYPTPYEAQQRIDSFHGSKGWAELAEGNNQYLTIGEKV